MATAQELVREIEKLTPTERVRLIDRVIRDTIRPDAEIEQIWVREATARWQAHLAEEGETIPYETVMANYRDRR